MKTNKIKIFFSIISFCFLVTSCNNLLSELTQQKTYIQISTNLGNTNQRTVLPDFSVVKENGYTWELYCDSKVLQTWSDDNGKSAYQNMCESKIEVDPGSYSFELKVKKENEIILKSETQTVTIEQNKNNELNFVLCPPTENEAKGSVNFKLTFPNEKVNIVKAYLFEPDDDKNEPFGNMQRVEITTEGSSSTANISVNDVPAGSYLLKVDLCYQVAEYSRIETINTYTTIVQVAAGFCSKAEVTLEELTDYYTITYMVDYDIITTFQESNVIPTTFKKNSNFRLPIAYNDNNQISIGWFIDPECTEEVNLNQDGTFTITDNITLYTQWGTVVNTTDLDFNIIDTNNTEGLLIKNETGLNYFRNIVNGTLTENIIVSDTVVYRKGTADPTVNAKLCSDINLPDDSEWVPIGYYKNDNDNKAYNGIFDGNGKCVTNLKNSNPTSSIGFFGYIETAIIKNLYVSGEINCDSSYNIYIGGIVGYAKSSGSNNSSISNCINNVSIKNEISLIEVGGILGYSKGGVYINSCVNIADITNCYSVAGILGYGDNNVTIKNCLNLGNLTSTSTFNNTAGICMTYNVNCNVTNCINTGIINNSSDDNVSPILKWSNTASESSPNCTNCFYDSDKIQNVVQGTPGTGKITSWFYTEDTNSEENLSDWSFASGRYPLPSTLQSIFDDVWAKLCKAAETGTTTWSALKSAIEDENSPQSEFVIINNLVATETIEISRSITISGEGVTISRGQREGNDFTGAFFEVYLNGLNIYGQDNNQIVFDGCNIDSQAPFINADATLEVSNCIFQNNTNTYTDGGAILISSGGGFEATNCEFKNNKALSNNSGGSIAILNDAEVNINNCIFESNSSTYSNGGGALYISKIYSDKFVNINNSTFTQNGANAIYVHKGSLSLSSVTMEENTTTINGESTTRDIYVYDIQPNGALEFDGVNSEILMNLCFGTGNNVNAKKIAVGSSFSMAESKKITVEFSGTTSNNFSVAADKPYFSFDDDINIDELVNTVNENFIFRYQNTTYTLTTEGKLTSSE